MAYAAPLWVRETIQNIVISDIGLESLVSGASLEYGNGTYGIYAINTDDSSNSTESDSEPSFSLSFDRLQFPAEDGVLTVYDGEGNLVGTVMPGLKTGFDFSFDDNWIQNSTFETYPNIRPSYGSDIVDGKSKRAVQLRNPGNRIGKFGGLGRNGETAIIIGDMIGDWLGDLIFSKRDEDSSDKFLLPVFVQGPGVTFTSLLGLEGIIYSEGLIKLVNSAALFLDVDDVIDYYDCEFCLLPTSSS